MMTFSKETTGAVLVANFSKNVANKTIVITGASSGSLGGQTAIDLAHSQPPPAHLILLARSEAKVQPVIDQINTSTTGPLAKFVPILLDDFDSIRSAAKAITDIVGPQGKIDILMNYAGIMAVPYSLSKAGIESQFATNHIGHFLLTLRLKSHLSKNARIINVSSDGYKLGRFDPEKYNFDDGKSYHPWSGYGQSKTANILFTKGLAKRGVISFALHPGVIFGTGLTVGMTDSDKLFEQLEEISVRNTGEAMVMGEGKTVEQGVATAIRAVVDPSLDGKNGSFLDDCEVVEVLDYARDDKLVESLWELSEKLVGEKFVI
ncbi:hypothetical protein LTR64_002992 [Lithohypha guttulata]|uniref:Short-chain dehydrogenase n=1 Tax=Lithohypha guttulata TaxID=1690604 RepID=A0AAN7T0Z6_9EURO|nr:hypothetical protein LTR51_000784 [Lithohypha guttulata]KAK5085968.1 hypothetical protein LTR05_005258 [Lithohypha guttulata]